MVSPTPTNQIKVLFGPDEKVFYLCCKMNSPAGTTKDLAIEVDDRPDIPMSCTSGTIAAPVRTVTAVPESARHAVERQRQMLEQFKEDMEKKPAAVSPEARAKKRAVDTISSEDDGQEERVVTITTTVVSKTVCDEDGNPATVTTTTESKSFGPPPEHVIHAQLVRTGKKSKKQLEKEIEKALNTCDYTHSIITDDPLHHAVNNEVKHSDVLFLNLKEFEEQDTEPVYVLFSNCNTHVGAKIDPNVDPTEHTCMQGCNDCFIDTCCEYLYGGYCFAAVKRYFNKNTHIAGLRDAYVYYVAHFNRQLDIHSYRESGNAESLRASTISKPTKCMKEGSLKVAMQWVQWQLNNGPHAEHYATERRKRQNLKRATIARQQRDNRRTKL